MDCEQHKHDVNCGWCRAQHIERETKKLRQELHNHASWAMSMQESSARRSGELLEKIATLELKLKAVRRRYLKAEKDRLWWRKVANEEATRHARHSAPEGRHGEGPQGGLPTDARAEEAVQGSLQGDGSRWPGE
jgi:hypothetical protein